VGERHGLVAPLAEMIWPDRFTRAIACNEAVAPARAFWTTVTSVPASKQGAPGAPGCPPRPPFGVGAPGSLPRVAASSGLVPLVGGGGVGGPVPGVPGPGCGSS